MSFIYLFTDFKDAISTKYLIEDQRINL